MAYDLANLPFDGAMLFWRIVLTIFFREIRPRGAYNIPRSGPVIFVGAPHHNQFLDLNLSLEVYKETNRHVQFLVAAKSMERRFVGFFCRLMDCIPVIRATDSAKTGKGKIRLSPDDPCLVIGEGTQFTSTFKPRMQIMLPRALGSLLAEVVEVISDDQLRIKKEFGGEKGTAKFRERDEAVDYKALPFVDQQEMYRHVYESLQNNGSIGIFPEGGSHDRTDLLPLKAGVSIMALGAMANNPYLKVKIVPVGLSYFHAHKFRSRGVVEFGTAFDVPTEFVESFKKGGAEKRDAVQRFLDLIYDALKTVTVRAPDYDTLMLIQAIRRLYKTPFEHPTLGQVVEMNRRLLEGYQVFKDEPQVVQLRKDVLKYNRMLRDLGLRDHQVPRARKASLAALGLLGYRTCLLLVWTALALPGTILNGPLLILASILSRKKAKEALAASTVKIAGRDVLATWKVLISMGVAPVLYGLYAALATLLVVRARLPFKYRILTPFAVTAALPFMNFAALKFGEAGFDVLKSLRPLILAVLPGQQKQLDKLKATREQLSNQVSNVINNFGPKIFDDFKEQMQPLAVAPPPSGVPGIWSRISSTGAVDAQGLGLNHPMTWLDERLFGWSHSATRGTNAWAGDATPHPPAESEPVESDDSDSGDYEHKVGNGKRSRTSSYADLQKLKLAPFSTVVLPTSLPPAKTPTGELDGIHFTRVHERKRVGKGDGGGEGME
ncbi:glycerol-3-phosphate O-acyltransferase [Mucidula mucida]|nr:glycerol-3-phosphate O-acyltransferase [Mucidula mucida]